MSSKRITRLVALAAATVALAAGTIPANASPSLPTPVDPRAIIGTGTTVQQLEAPSSPELDAYLATLSAAEREHFLATNIPTTMTTKVRIISGPSVSAGSELNARQCWTARRDGDIRGGINNVLLKFWHVGRWCANNGVMEGTDIVEYGGQPVSAGWRYEGRINSGRGVVNNEARTYSQFRFTFGTGGWDIIEEAPCARVIGRTNGTLRAADFTCGIY